MDYTLNIRGRLHSLQEPQVMGILNCTPDSFYQGSRSQTEAEIARRANEIIEQGATIIDVGAMSTRPGGDFVTEAEELRRMRMALAIVRREQPEAIVSIDTFRPSVAQMAVEEFGADVINDVSEGGVTGIEGVALEAEQHGGDEPFADYPAIFKMVARLGVPYVLMSVQPTLRETLLTFARKVQMLRDLGQKDIILDPGYGFGKDLEQNYALLRQQEMLLCMDLPLLVGVSRKRMVWQLLGSTPDEALNGTTALNMVALQKGASILRVHDVREAVECVELFRAMNR